MKSVHACVTLYFGGLLGMSKVEAKSCEIEVKPFAQYERGIYVKYVPKGKRKAREFVQSYRPSLVVLEGWGHPEPDSMFLPSTDGGVTAHGRYSACDPRWEKDLAAKLAEHSEKTGAKVLHDFRGHEPGSRVSYGAPPAPAGLG